MNMKRYIIRQRRRRRGSIFRLKISITLLAIGFIIFLPLIVPTALVWHGVYLRRLRAAADQFKCTGCGQILGRKSIQLADEKWARRRQEFMNRYPGIKCR